MCLVLLSLDSYFYRASGPLQNWKQSGLVRSKTLNTPPNRSVFPPVHSPADVRRNLITVSICSSFGMKKNPIICTNHS